MLSNKMLRCCVAVMAVAGAGLAQARFTVETKRIGRSYGQPAAAAELFELALIRQDDGAARVELRGGQPGNPAVLVLAASPDHVAADPLLPDCPLVVGRFDAQGAFATPVDLSASKGSSFAVQGRQFGFARDGSLVHVASYVLEVAVREAPACRPVTVPDADFSLLRIELGGNHLLPVLDHLADRDLVGALGEALNSSGDRLLVKLGGKITVPVSGISMGGSVAVTAKVERRDENGVPHYYVSFGRDVAALVGVKATEDIGVEGGLSLGADEIYGFASAGEAARGIRGMAILQGLGKSVQLANADNLARFRQARAVLGLAQRALAGHQARSSRLRLPRIEAALTRARDAAVRAFAAVRRLGDAIEAVLALLVNEVQFMRVHIDGAELRLSAPGTVEVKIGSSKFKCFKAEVGAQAGADQKVTVRLRQGYRQPVQSVTIGAERSMSAGMTLKLSVKGVGPDLEAEGKVTVEAKSLFVRNVQGRFDEPELSLTLKHELKIGPFGRETSIAVDPRELGSNGMQAVTALLSGDATGSRDALCRVPFTVAVQDKWERGVKRDFGWKKGFTATVDGQVAWADAGPERELSDVTLPDIIKRMTDVERITAGARELAVEVNALRDME